MSVTFHLTENAALPAIPLAPLPGQPGYAALICPQCGDRCGHLYDGQRCLACEVGWTDPSFPRDVECDILGYTCRCGRDWPVLIERAPGGDWVIVKGDDERCPGCGQWGACDEEAPDTYWNAAERCGEEEPDVVIETAGGPITFFFI